MRFPWSRSPEVAALQRELDAEKRKIETTRPIVEEAIRQTNDSFIAVEKRTRHAARRISLENALLRDLAEGWNGHG